MRLAAYISVFAIAVTGICCFSCAPSDKTSVNVITSFYAGKTKWFVHHISKEGTESKPWGTQFPSALVKGYCSKSLVRSTIFPDEIFKKEDLKKLTKRYNSSVWVWDVYGNLVLIDVTPESVNKPFPDKPLVVVDRSSLAEVGRFKAKVYQREGTTTMSTIRIRKPLGLAYRRKRLCLVAENHRTNEIELWEIDNDKEELPVKGLGALSHDRKNVAILTGEGKIIVYEVETLKPLLQHNVPIKAKSGWNLAWDVGHRAVVVWERFPKGDLWTSLPLLYFYVINLANGEVGSRLKAKGLSPPVLWVVEDLP